MHGLPYIDIPLTFGPIKTFGVLLFIGIVFASWMSRKYCQRNGLDDATMEWLGVRLIVWGLIGAVALDILFYDFPRFLEHPWTVVKALGISSYGAIVGSAVAFFYYTGKKKLDRRQWGDAASWGVAGGWLFGRLGCALAHDHLGVKTDSPLGVNVPPMRYGFEHVNHVIRAYDLGLFEFVLWIPLLLMVVLLERRKNRRPGMILGTLAVAYSIPRFLFEFLRLDRSDPRHGGLTFAQWASIAAFAIGLQLLFGKVKAVKESREPEAPAGKRRVRTRT
jgi:phosphatidylglycerol:prolipoprotein diacylglycerol transferase